MRRIRLAPLVLVAALALGGCVTPHSGGGPATGGTAATADGAPSLDRTLRLARAARQGGDLAGAIRLYRQAVEAEPNNAWARVELGDALHAAEAYHEAIETFSSVAKGALPGTGDPAARAAALTGMGRATLGLRRAAEAIEHFEAALAIDPGRPVALNGKAVALDMLGRHEAAQKVYRKLIEQDRGNLRARANYGLSLAISGRHEKAVEVLDAVVMERRAGPRARQNLAVAYGLMGDYEAAAQVMRTELGERAVKNNLEYLDTVRFLLAAHSAQARHQAKRPFINQPAAE